jgi:mannose-6-phosphate isomerase-like protein (cupin superfamily)
MHAQFEKTIDRRSRALLIGVVLSLLPALSSAAEKPQQAPKPEKVAMKALQPGVFKIEDILKKGLDQKAGGFNFSVIAEAKTGSVELFQIENVKSHFHPSENHFLYIIKGKAKGQIGEVTAEVGPGDLLVIPAGKRFQHKLRKLGDEPVVFLLFSTPPFKSHDIVWVEK